MKVLVVGGTGFVGYHIVRRLRERGHEAGMLARRRPGDVSKIESDVKTHAMDINSASDNELRGVVAGYDGVIFAAGVDDRIVPRAPAYEFYYKGNVEPVSRLFTASREAGVRRGVLLGSYFTYIDRKFPEMRLAERHPYIRSRKLQQEEFFKASRPSLEAVAIELPYIFGKSPGRLPLWASLVWYVQSPLPGFTLRGGTNVISVRHVAEAVVGAIERGVPGETYAVGDRNMAWTDLLMQLAKHSGVEKKFTEVPPSILKAILLGVSGYHAMLGKESGLELANLADLLTMETYIDTEPARKALGYGSGGLEEALNDTVEASMAGIKNKGLQELIPL